MAESPELEVWSIIIRKVLTTDGTHTGWSVDGEPAADELIGALEMVKFDVLTQGIDYSMDEESGIGDSE